MKVKIICLISVVLAMSLLGGCLSVSIGPNIGVGSHGSVRGEGEIMVFPVETGDFTSVSVGGVFEIDYRQSSVRSITVEIQENLFEHLSFSVTDGLLTVRSETIFTVDWNSTPRLTIYAPTLEQVIFSGASSTGNWDTLIAEDLSLHISGASSATIPIEANRLSVNISGAGNINLHGEADIVDFQTSGAADISAGELQTRIANISISGAGNVTIACSEELNATLSGAGSLRYIGDPFVTQRIMGVGSISQIG